MTYEQLEEGLYKGEQNPAVVESAPQPVYGVPAAGYQQGYPVQQQPLVGWPAYGAPGAYGTGMPAGMPGYPAQPYPYPPPPPMGGGSEDEKYQMSDVGVATIVPGLKVPKHRYILILCAVIMLVGAGSMFGMGGWIATISGVSSIVMWIFGVLELAFAILLLKLARRSRPTIHGSITQEHIQAFIDRVTKIGATLPQLNLIQSLMNQANPNTPHEFIVWKSLATANGHPRSLLIAARFGCQNLTRGQKPQQHLYALLV